MGIEARVAELRDFLRQKFYSIGGIAKDNGLIDL